MLFRLRMSWFSSGAEGGLPPGSADPREGNPRGRIAGGKSGDQAIVEFFLARDDFKVLQRLGICPAFLASMLRSAGRHRTAPG